MANINIFSLGGQDENGKNCFVIEINNSIFVVNSGIKVPINNRYGVDGIIPDFEYLISNKHRLKGVFITHAHDEVFAALPWMIMDIKGLKIYGSKFTKQVIEDRVSKYKIDHKEFEIKVIDKPLNFGDVVVEPFSVANAIPGSYGFKFKTRDGNIIVMSNFIIDDLNEFGFTNLNKIKGPEPTLALLMDSRRANFPGKSSEHKSVKKIIEPKFASAKVFERIIIGAFDEEMYALQEVLELAVKFNRPVALYGRTYQMLLDILMQQNPKIKLPKIVDYKSINKFNNIIVLVTGTWARLYKRFVRIAERADVYLTLKNNDKIIMIAPPINGLEVEYTQMLDKITAITPHITEVTYSDYYSLRPAGDDIKRVIQLFKPKYFIPISALYRYLVVAKKLAISQGQNIDSALVLQNGKVAWFKDRTLVSQKGKIKEQSETIIDGFGVGDISFEVIKERETLSANGFVSIVAQVNNKTRKIIPKTLNLKFIGVASTSKINELKDIVEKAIVKKIAEFEKWDVKEVQNSVKKRVQKVVYKLIEKKPLTVVTFY